MNIAFRTDASLEIGTGHVMRCLSLADALRARGARCVFICRPHKGHLLALIAERGHEAIALPELTSSPQTSSATAHEHWLGTDGSTDAEDTHRAIAGRSFDWLVVDHYALAKEWEQAMRPHCKHLLTIDDLADRQHACDLLLDQNLGRAASDYNKLVAAETKMFIGPMYSLLRPEFAEMRPASLIRRDHIELKTILITLGGVDKDNVTGRILTVMSEFPFPSEVAITVVMGPHAPWLTQVQAQAARMKIPTTVLAGVRNMAELMTVSDLAIGAAGSTSWERCCLGLPTIQMVLADNQIDAAGALANLGAVESIQSLAGIAEELPALLQQLSTHQLRVMSQHAATVCDGQGAVIIAEELVSRINNLEGTNE